MNDNNLSDPTECINASHFSDQNYANPNDLMNPYSTSMPSPAPTPNLNHLSASIHLANDTENSPSNNNYANDDNELNNDQLNFGNSSDLQNYNYYEAHDPNPATFSDSQHSIASQEERKVVDNISGELSNVSFDNN